MNIQEVWAVIEPYVYAITGTGLGGVIMYLLSRLLTGKLLQKFNVNGVVSGVAEKLAGSTINVDLTAVTEKKLAEIEAKQEKRVTEQEAKIERLTRLVGHLCGALAASRTLTEAQREQLKKDEREACEDCPMPEPEVKPVIELKPIEAKETGRTSLVNFE